MPRSPSNPKPRKRARSEKSIQSSILRWLVSTGLLHWRQSAGLLKVGRKKIRLGPSGIPDILVVVGPHGRLLGLEVKSATGKQRPSQEEFQEKMETAGAVYRIVRSVAEAKAAVESLRFSVPDGKWSPSLKRYLTDSEYPISLGSQ